MEIILNKIEKTLGVIKVSINKADFQLDLDKKYKEYSKKAQIKGFRQGKIPIGVIQKMYGKALIVDEVNKLVSEKLNAYLRKGDVHFIGKPVSLDTTQEYDWENQTEFQFEYEIGFTENFDLKIKKTKLDYYIVNVDDKVIDETIERLQYQFSKVENPVISSKRDFLYGQITSKEGEMNQEVTIDLRKVEKNLLEKMIGIKVGTAVVFNPKKGFKNENILKKMLQLDDSSFKKLNELTFVLKKINHYKLIPVDQILFDKVSKKGTIKDEAGFRKYVKDVVSQQYKSKSEQLFEKHTQERLIESTKIPLPDEFLKKNIVPHNEDMTPKVFENEYHSFTNGIRWSLIKEEIIKEEKITISDEEIIVNAKERIKKQILETGMESQMTDEMINSFINNYLKEDDGKNYTQVFEVVQTNKVMQHLKKEAVIKEKTISLDEFDAFWS